jgi:FkbM family methyltransferase
VTKLPEPARIAKEFLIAQRYHDKYYLAHNLPSLIVSKFKRDAHLESDQIINVFGNRMIVISGDKGISKELRLFGVHEPLITAALRELLSEGMQCLEVGANIGYYMLLESSAIGSSGSVIALEPVPRTFTYLRRNAELNELKNVKLQQLALGDRDGIAKMALSKSSNLSHIVNENSQNLPSPRAVSSVPMLTLNTFVKEQSLRKLDLLRMDVEGYEWYILSGGFEALARLRPTLMIEFHVSSLGPTRSVSMLQMLERIGYSIRCCVPRYWDYRFSSIFYRGSRNLDISQLIKRIRAREMTDDCNIIFHNVERAN